MWKQLWQRWFKGGGAPDARVPRGAPLPDLMDLLGPTGKVSTEKLRQIALALSAHEFEAFLRVPVLAGEAIQLGTVEETEKRKIHKKGTMMFLKASAPAPEGAAAETLQSAIYPLFKVRHHDEGPGALTFRVGRVDSNDITMPDFSISELHAVVIAEGGGHVIEDQGSTNGTFVNGEKLKPQQKRALDDGDILGLARYEFTYLRPGALYARLRVPVAGAPPAP